MVSVSDVDPSTTSGDQETVLADLAARYATAGAETAIEALTRADANDVAVPVFTRLSSAHDEWEVNSLDGARRRRLARIEQADADAAHLHDLLTDRDVAYALIKTRFSYAHRPWDLNLLARRDDWESVVAALTESGWERTTVRAHPLARLEPGKRLYTHPIRHPVHLHAAVSWNGSTYASADVILENRIQDDGVFVPPPALDATIHCAHSVFENFEQTLGEAFEITRALGSDPTVGRDLADAFGWTRGFDLALETAREIRSAVDQAPTSVRLPASYRPAALGRAWLQHARSDHGRSAAPLVNAGLWWLK